jgi:hypothetical protein
MIPTDVSGLRLWLKADSLALNDGDPVGTWADSSGNGLDFTQGTAANKPTYIEDVSSTDRLGGLPAGTTSDLNPLPVVRFDGSNDYLSRAAFATAETDGAIFAVYASRAVFDNRNLFSQYNSGDGSKYFVMRHGAPGLPGRFYLETRNGAPSPTVMYGSSSGGADIYYILCLQSSGSGYTIHASGVAHYGEFSDTVASGNNGDWFGDVSGINVAELGATSAFGQYFWGDVGEFIVYDSNVSASDRSGLYAYLKEKWITVGAPSADAYWG